jgi:hypothetical protein
VKEELESMEGNELTSHDQIMYAMMWICNFHGNILSIHYSSPRYDACVMWLITAGVMIDAGVFEVTCDQHTQRVTVTSNADPLRLLKRVKRIKKKSEFWPRGAAGSTTPIKYVNHAIHPAASYNQSQFSTQRSQAPGSLSHKHERHYSTTQSSETPLARSHMRDTTAPVAARRVPQDPEMHMRTSSVTGRRSVRPDIYHMQEMDYSSRPYYRPEGSSFDTFPVSFTDSSASLHPIPDHFRPPYAQTYETEESTPLYTYY